MALTIIGFFSLFSADMYFDIAEDIKEYAESNNLPIDIWNREIILSFCIQLLDIWPKTIIGGVFSLKRMNDIQVFVFVILRGDVD